MSLRCCRLNPASLVGLAPLTHDPPSCPAVGICVHSGPSHCLWSWCSRSVGVVSRTQQPSSVARHKLSCLNHVCLKAQPPHGTPGDLLWGLVNMRNLPALPCKPLPCWRHKCSETLQLFHRDQTLQLLLSPCLVTEATTHTYSIWISFLSLASSPHQSAAFLLVTRVFFIKNNTILFAPKSWPWV